jgi:hypothetical protein
LADPTRLLIEDEPSKKYYAGQPVNDAQIQVIYDPWGCWQYLAYWFDAV